MKQRGISPTLCIYNTLMRGCNYHNKFEYTISLYTELKINVPQVTPDIKVFAHLIEAYLHLDNLADALILLNEMQNYQLGSYTLITKILMNWTLSRSNTHTAIEILKWFNAQKSEMKMK